jgi:hypothetical protein
MKFSKLFFVSVLSLFQYQISSAQTDLISKNSVVRSPIFLSLGYRMPVNNNIIINSGHGLFFELGINPLYFISKKQLLGIYGGIATRDNLWNTSFTSSYISDYSNSINDVYDGINLEIINASKQLFSERKGTSTPFPGCETRSFHTAALYYGILARIPLPKCPLILKLYTGKNETSFRGGEIVTKNKEYNYFAIKRFMYGCELSVFPGMKKINNSVIFENIARIYLGTISLYYEYCDFYNAQLYFTDGDNRISLPLNTFLNSGFLKKYRQETTFGMKLAINIY